MHEAGRLRVPVHLFRANKDAIRAEIEARGYNERNRSYARTFDREEMDASLLTLPLHGYVEGMLPADALHLRPHPREIGARRAPVPPQSGHRRRATARRGRLRHLQLLGGRRSEERRV